MNSPIPEDGLLDFNRANENTLFYLYNVSVNGELTV
jgi:hypothetical protein